MTNTPPIARLLDIMAALRTPQTGCPWDLAQTFATIAPYTIEEAYEVADAIERGDLADLKDELGDLLLQVVYHARMAEEQGAFAFDDVAEAINRKMIRRHPHVFGTAPERAAGAEPGFWERLKAQEKADKAQQRRSIAPVGGAALGAPSARSPHPDRSPQPSTVGPAGRHEDGSTLPTASLLDNTPLALPALTRAIKLQGKAASVGFDWPSLAPVFDKMREELAELEDVLGPSGAAAKSPENQAKIEAEFGDLLFVMANVARHLGLDPEAALRATNAKFTRRFQHIETRLSQQGSSPAQSTLEAMDALWNEAKAIERTPDD